MSIDYNNLVPLHVDKVTGSIVAAHKGNSGNTSSGNSNSLARVDIVGGSLIMTFTNGTTETVGSVGSGGSGVSVTGANINSIGELIITLSDGTTINAGVVQGEPGLGIASAEINENGYLILTLSDGSLIDLGYIIGADGVDGTDGTDGISVVDVEINSAGDLVVTLSDGNVINAGNATGNTVSTAAVLIELTSNGDHAHALSLTTQQAMDLIDGSISSVVVTSTSVDNHTHDVTVTYTNSKFVVTDVTDNHLHGFVVVGTKNNPTGYRHNQDDAVTNWLIQHNQGTTNAITQVYVENELVIPTAIKFIDINTIEVFFNEPLVGFTNTIFYTQE